MKKEDYILYSGVVLSIATLLHLWRAFNGWSLTLGPYDMPMMVSYIVIVIGAYLSYSSYKLRK